MNVFYGHFMQIRFSALKCGDKKYFCFFSLNVTINCDRIRLLVTE